MKNNLPLALIALFCLIRFWFMPQRERAPVETHARQQDALTHDTAAFASIQNLSALTLEWEDGAYSFSRAQVEAILGAPLPSPLDKAVWKLRVQARLSDPAFLAQFFA